MVVIIHKRKCTVGIILGNNARQINAGTIDIITLTSNHKGEEWKVMGLAPYGQLNQEFYQLLKSTISIQGFDCLHQSSDLFASISALDKFKRRDQERRIAQ
jgi:predicted NodU family carbamoyl transferase